MSDREQLRAERRRLEDDYKRAYEARDSHFLLYGEVDGPEPIGFCQTDDAGYALPDEFPNDNDAEHDFTEEDLVT